MIIGENSPHIKQIYFLMKEETQDNKEIEPLTCHIYRDKNINFK